MALHVAVGGLTGGVQGAVGAGASQVVVDQVGQAIRDSNLPPEVKQALVLAAGTAVGAAVGDVSGAAAAFNATANNYLQHTELRSRQQQLAACKDENCRKQVRAYWDKVSQERQARTGEGIVTSGVAANLQTMERLSSEMGGLAQYRVGLEEQLRTTADPAQRANLQQQISDAEGSMRQIASQGKDALALLYQQTGDPKYQNAYQALNIATSGNEIGAALMLPGGGGGNVNRMVQEVRPGVSAAEQAATARARVENNASRDDNMTTGLLPAERVNRVLADRDFTDPFTPGTYVNVDVVRGGKIVNMVIGPGQAQAIGEGRPALGQFATPESVPSVSDARSRLAITEVMKPPGGLLVQPITATGRPMVIIEGSIAPQAPSVLYPGGGRQIFFDYPQLGTRLDYVKPVGTPQILPPR